MNEKQDVINNNMIKSAFILFCLKISALNKNRKPKVNLKITHRS